MISYETKQQLSHEFQLNDHALKYNPLNPEAIENFRTNQERAIKQLNSSSSKPHIVYQKNILGLTGGYGNMMYLHINSLLLTILRPNSLLFINWPNVYIAEPLYGSFQYAAKFHAVLDANKNYTYKMPRKTKNSYSMNKNLQKVPLRVNNQGYNYTLVDGIAALFFEIACDLDHADTLVRYGLTSKQTVNNLREYFDNRSAYNAAASNDALFRIGFEDGHHLLNIFCIAERFAS